jgi:adenosylcobinamide-GDP ribazoletransferase
VTERFRDARRRLVLALAFLTRLPLDPGAVDDGELAAALTAFPAVGLLLGAALVLLDAVLASRLPAEVRAALLVGVLAAATGGLHLDGVADLCDALGGGRGERERMLAILRDSRIGAHAAVGVSLLLVTQVAALAAVLRLGDSRGVLLFAAAARFAVVPCIAWFRYAREEGLGTPFRGAGPGAVWSAGAVFVLACLVTAPGRGLAAGGAALLVALGLAGWVNHKLGGLTGDVYGAAIEVAEVAFLLAWLALP